MPKEKLACFSAKMNPILAAITNITHGQGQFVNLFWMNEAIHYYRDLEIATVRILPHPPYHITSWKNCLRVLLAVKWFYK